MRALEIALSDLLIEFSGTSFPKKKMPKPAFLLSELHILILILILILCTVFLYFFLSFFLYSTVQYPGTDTVRYSKPQ